MRGLGMFLLIAIVVVLMGATAVLFRRYEKRSADFAEAESRYTEAINAIAEIQDSLFAIVPADSAVLVPGPGLETEQSLTEPQTRQALDRIEILKQSIARTKERIENLEGRLNRSGVRIGGLERLIASLKQSVAQKETQVAELAVRVDSLQIQVVSLEGAVQQGQETIRARDEELEERRKELATIYLLMGTRKELSQTGVIVARGGFLGIGKTVQLTGRYDGAELSTLDTDRETLVRAPGAKVRILSAQPPSSYELRQEGDATEIHILDPGEFRKVKHLVIMTG